MNVPEVPQREKVSPIEFSRVIKGINEKMDVIIDKVVSPIKEILRKPSGRYPKLRTRLLWLI